MDALREEVRDTFFGASKPPNEWPTVRIAVAIPEQTPGEIRRPPRQTVSTHRPGYDKKQVDTFLDKAEPRLAAMRATTGASLIDSAHPV